MTFLFDTDAISELLRPRPARRAGGRWRRGSGRLFGPSASLRLAGGRAFHRKCWSFDLVDRPDPRPEIEPFQWNPESLRWPVKVKEKPDLIFLDPPYFNKMAEQYSK